MKKLGIDTDSEKAKVSLAMYDVILSIRDTVSLPTHKTLFKTAVYSLIITVITVVCRLLNYYTFLHWAGCLACTICLWTLLWVERTKDKQMQRAYAAGAAYLRRNSKKLKSLIVGKKGGNQ